jgi:diphosphoinositol-polyphosphate diphosphatase
MAYSGYGTQGERLVAGVVPLSEDKYYVLLVQSTSRGHWIIPKGGWETDETVEEAAKREAWEEAGIVCKINYDLGIIPDLRRANQLTTSAPKASYHFYEATVEKQEAQWPEMNKRTRMWMTFSQAETALKDRPELLEALKRCTMHR